MLPFSFEDVRAVYVCMASAEIPEDAPIAAVPARIFFRAFLLFSLIDILIRL